MKIGIPREIKIEEYRVGLTPLSVKELVNSGHQVFIEHDAGTAIHFTNEDYEAAGAKVLKTAADIYAEADMIVKVKEPQPAEYKLLREHQILFTYLHLAPDPEQAKALLESKCIAIAYETVTAPDGSLPLLSPMSQVAGRLSIQAGAHYLEKPNGGKGLLLGGVPGVYPGKVVVIGGGVVGTNAVRMAVGKGADVVVLDRSLSRLQALDSQFGGLLTTLYSTSASITEQIREADLVIGAVLVPGKAAPRLITRSMLSEMKPGTVFVDVAIDQGGCAESSRATTHNHPTYIEDNIVHYCVANMPGAVPRTSTLALNNATLPYVMALANKGYRKALMDDVYFREGLNVFEGHITHAGVASDLGLIAVPPESCLSMK